MHKNNSGRKEERLPKHLSVLKDRPREVQDFRAHSISSETAKKTYWLRKQTDQFASEKVTVKIVTE